MSSATRCGEIAGTSCPRLPAGLELAVASRRPELLQLDQTTGQGCDGLEDPLGGEADRRRTGVPVPDTYNDHAGFGVRRDPCCTAFATDVVHPVAAEGER